MKVLIVTGMSGAGKSNAVKSLEDMGFYCIDNMPPRLISQFMELSEIGTGEIEKAAFVVDIRGGEFFDDLLENIKEMRSMGCDFRVMFLEASDEVLIRRYKETRRKHPMSINGGIREGIQLERKRLENIRKISDFIVDTSTMRPIQLRETISKLLDKNDAEIGINFTVTIMSFGFKYGLPLEADNVVDVRFIPNPFYLRSLKKLTGNNQKVSNYVLKWEETQKFIDSAHEMFNGLIPYYIKQGRTSLVIAVGCTGGQHRSVAIANEFNKRFKADGFNVNLIHRDVSRSRI